MIQMPPPSKGYVIVQRQNDATFRATKSSIASVAKKDIDALGL
jgi:hypothetical protein